MPDFTIKQQPKTYDVCIVGSGAGGGMAAYVLSKAGIKVALLEAGPMFDPANQAQRTQLKWSYESPRRGAGTTRPFGDFDAAYGGWQIDGEPYTTEANTEFNWFRSRMIGGRTNHWGRISLRFGPNDFKRKSLDGLGDDWPIGYDDVKPFYDKVDQLIGVFGTKEGIYNEPDGYFLPPPKPRLHELFIKQGAEKAGVKIIPGRLSMLTRPIKGRQSCFYCSQCNRTCQIYADFSSSSILVKPAIQTGNVDVFTGAMAREVLTDKNGKATGVSYVNKADLQEYQVKAKVVMLAASSCESARLLLNSKSSRHPNGLANSSEVVGKYLHDSTGAGRGAVLPKLFGRKRYNEDGVGGMHLYSPWWLDNKKLNFPRGYHIEYGGGMDMPGYGFGWGMDRTNGKFAGRDGKIKTGGGYGASLKDDYRWFYGAGFGMAGRGECIPRADNYCAIDPTGVVDKYGIPVLRFHYTWSDHEINQAKHMQDTFEEIIHNMGGITMGEKPGAESNYGLARPGEIIHEVGTVRMGSDPRKAALNKFNQSFDCPNLFVVDGGAFVSQADKNPTWTILALSMRASEYVMDQLKKQQI